MNVLLFLLFKGDNIMNARYNGYSLALKGLAFIPSIGIFVVFGILIWIYGRLPKPTKEDPYGGRLKKRKKRFGNLRNSWRRLRLGWQRLRQTHVVLTAFWHRRHAKEPVVVDGDEDVVDSGGGRGGGDAEMGGAGRGWLGKAGGDESDREVEMKLAILSAFKTKDGDNQTGKTPKDVSAAQQRTPNASNTGQRDSSKTNKARKTSSDSQDVEDTAVNDTDGKTKSKIVEVNGNEKDVVMTTTNNTNNNGSSEQVKSVDGDAGKVTIDQIQGSEQESVNVDSGKTSQDQVRNESKRKSANVRANSDVHSEELETNSQGLDKTDTTDSPATSSLTQEQQEKLQEDGKHSETTQAVSKNVEKSEEDDDVNVDNSEDIPGKTENSVAPESDRDSGQQKLKGDQGHEENGGGGQEEEDEKDNEKDEESVKDNVNDNQKQGGDVD
jgi:hypothetical protein